MSCVAGERVDCSWPFSRFVTGGRVGVVGRCCLGELYVESRCAVIFSPGRHERGSSCWRTTTTCLFFGGKGGKASCTVTHKASCVGLRQGLPVGLLAHNLPRCSQIKPTH